MTRPLRVQLHGKDQRIRFTAEMNAGEVWAILGFEARDGAPLDFAEGAVLR
jgi:hypothetical protein